MDREREMKDGREMRGSKDCTDRVCLADCRRGTVGSEWDVDVDADGQDRWDR